MGYGIWLDLADWRHDSAGYDLDVDEVAGPLDDRQLTARSVD